MNDYLRFVESIQDEIEVFREKQARSVKEMADRLVIHACIPLGHKYCADCQVFRRDARTERKGC